MNLQHKALLDVIRAFKPPEISDLEAALNTIINHAAQIRRLHEALKEIRDAAAATKAVAQDALGEGIAELAENRKRGESPSGGAEGEAGR